MNKTKFLVIYNKNRTGWSVHISSAGIFGNIHGINTKREAVTLFNTMKRFYNHGRHDEFVANNIKTDKLMKRFGL